MSIFSTVRVLTSSIISPTSAYVPVKSMFSRLARIAIVVKVHAASDCASMSTGVAYSPKPPEALPASVLSVCFEASYIASTLKLPKYFTIDFSIIDIYFIVPNKGNTFFLVSQEIFQTYRN